MHSCSGSLSYSETSPGTRGSKATFFLQKESRKTRKRVQGTREPSGLLREIEAGQEKPLGWRYYCTLVFSIHPFCRLLLKSCVPKVEQQRGLSMRTDPWLVFWTEQMNRNIFHLDSNFLIQLAMSGWVRTMSFLNKAVKMSRWIKDSGACSFHCSYNVV